MGAALVDANVVFAFRSARDQYHDQATAIVRAMDAGELPRGIIANYTLPEILNPITKRAGHDHAVETLEFLERSGGFELRHLANEDLARGRSVFREQAGVEITDAVLAAYMDRTETEYIYSFDDDFDRFDHLTRLTSPENPFEP
ncbi:type II toxin-antitoxin system VapC family toxin [Natranaeroarchaeum aerophilus]|uniref:PIN domain-containing protein n=1 Tax=Natranaeroarchaeum aerophilus TaxID=2917711 RepID=A0AAE3K6D1_9EURY|nr:PIN domain-containing protein [Natranaeroarchaeum aerophilus]MCL9815112.1 PIN domain-containing protein [Natranaeroarchaeum aerophilus]